MMKKKTVRLISCIIAGILVAAMVFSMIASGLVYAGAVSSKELKSKLSDLEDQKASVKAELDSLAGKVDEVAKTRAALQKEIKLTKEEITTVTAYIDRLQDQIDVKTTELDAAIKALDSKKERFSETVRTTYEQGETSYLEVLLNASNFSDLLSRLEIVSAIMDDNKKIVAEYTAAKEDIQQKRDDLQATQDEQVQYQENLKYKAEELKSSEEQQKALQKSLQAYQKEQKAEYERITSEMDTVSDQIAEQSRKEAAAAAAAAAAAKKKGGSSSSSSSSSAGNLSSATLTSGTFTWPLPGYTNNSECLWLACTSNLRYPQVPQGRGYSGTDRHTDRSSCIRHGYHRRLGFRLRQLYRYQSWRRRHDGLRPSVCHPCFGWPEGNCRSDHRSGRLHRQPDRSASAL